METRHHRPDGDVQDLGNLFVGKPLHVGQQDRHPEVFGKFLDCRFHVGIYEVLENLIFGTSGGAPDSTAPIRL